MRIKRDHEEGDQLKLTGGFNSMKQIMQYTVQWSVRTHPQSLQWLIPISMSNMKLYK